MIRQMMRQTETAWASSVRSRISHCRVTVFIGIAAGLLALLVASSARAQIKQPGAHPDYSVEIEPHLLLMWDSYAVSDQGWGPGLRVSIPIVQNGPITTINNSMAIGFGLDWGHFSHHCGSGWDWWGGRWWDPHNPYAYPYGNEHCTANAFMFPVVLQWNFFITKVFSVFGEPGLAITHTRWSFPAWCPGGGWGCENDETHTGLDPVFQIGGRVHFGNMASFTFRLGWPYVSAGVSFFL